jgi:hypothetical protein
MNNKTIKKKKQQMLRMLGKKEPSYTFGGNVN